MKMESAGSGSRKAPARKNKGSAIAKAKSPKSYARGGKSVGNGTRISAAGTHKGRNRIPNNPNAYRDEARGSARSNKGGATRGKARAAQVKKMPTGMRKAPLPSTQAATQVGINAYRDYANSMTNLAQTGIRGPGFQMPNLNPFDYIGQGLDALGNAITGAVRGTPNPGANVMAQGERIRDVLNGR